MGSSGYTLIPSTSTYTQPARTEDMRYLNRLSYAAPAIPESNPASDSLTIPTSSSPPKYTSVMHDDLGYRVGQGGMAPKGGIYWSPPNSPKTAELQQQRQQQHRTWKLEQQQQAQPTADSSSPEMQFSASGNGQSNEVKPKKRRLRKLLRKLSTGSSSEE